MWDKYAFTCDGMVGKNWNHIPVRKMLWRFWRSRLWLQNFDKSTPPLTKTVRCVCAWRVHKRDNLSFVLSTVGQWSLLCWFWPSTQLQNETVTLSTIVRTLAECWTHHVGFGVKVEVVNQSKWSSRFSRWSCFATGGSGMAATCRSAGASTSHAATVIHCGRGRRISGVSTVHTVRRTPKMTSQKGSYSVLTTIAFSLLRRPQLWEKKNPSDTFKCNSSNFTEHCNNIVGKNWFSRTFSQNGVL